MIPGMNPRQMRQMMKKVGMQQEDLDVREVIFRMEDKELVCSSPQVSKVNMMGQETFQVAGSFQERSIDSTPDISQEDIQTVADQAECSFEDAKKAIEDADGDLAEAIMKLRSN